jgi:proteasome accessory factor C
VRNFLIEHMRAIELLERDISAEAKAVGDIEDATYVAEVTDTTVTVEVTPEAYRLISEFQTVSEPKDVGSGTIRSEIKVGHLPNIGRLIAKYGGAAKVIAPPEARDYVRQYALAALGEDALAEQREIE